MEIFHWGWLAILLGSAVALRTTIGWRRSVARHSALMVDVTILAVVAELVWRIAAPATVLPLGSWAAALFFLSLSLSVLDRRREAEGLARDANVADSGWRPHEGAFAEDPFRSVAGAGERAGSAAPLPAAGSEAWARRCLEQTAEAIAVLDPDAEIEWANPAWARLHGYKADEVRGHHVSLFYKPDQTRELLLPALTEARETGCWEGEVEHRAKDGSRFTTRMSLSLLRQGGRPMGFVAVARGAGSSPAPEPRHRPPEAVAEPEADALHGVAASVAHELNNLLTGILGNASLLRRQTAAGVTEEIRDIEAAARRAAELTRLLQVKTGKAGPAAEPIASCELAGAFPGEEPKEAAAAPSTGMESAPAEDGTILVIDNEKIIRDFAASVLSRQGFSVLTAADGEPALALFRRHREAIRAVLLDLSMPLMGGEDVFRGLRSIDPGARVVLMTGHDVNDVSASFEEGGLAGILQKPFRPEELLAAIRAALA